MKRTTLILVVSFLLRLPSLFEPNWYGDEGIYQVLGRGVREGGLLYRDLWDNKPPLLYLIYALVNGDHFGARLFSLIFMLAAIPAFFYLAKKLFKNGLAIYISTGIFAFLFSTPLLEGNIANAENFMLLPIILAAFIIINYTLSPKPYTLLIAGLLLSGAFLIKIVAIFDVAAFLLFLFFTKQWKAKNLTGQLKKFTIDVFPLALGFLIPVLLTVLFFITKGVLADFLLATFSQNVDYVGVNKPLLAKTLVLAGVCGFIFLKRKLLGKVQLFILIWVAFSIYNALFGQRPWTHYLLVILPSFSLALGAIFESKKYQLLNLATIIFILILISGNFWIYGKTPFYYQNFFSFMFGEKTLSSYYDFFAPHVLRDYEVASFLRGRVKPGERVFIWGDNAQVYTLLGSSPPGRYTVSYHITFYPNAVYETTSAIRRNKPKYIALLREILSYEELLRGYKLKFVIAGVQIYEKNDFLP